MFEYNFNRQNVYPLPRPRRLPPHYILYLLKLCFNITHYTHLARLQPANSRPGSTFYWKSRRGGAQQKWWDGKLANMEIQRRESWCHKRLAIKQQQGLHKVWRVSIKIIFIASLIFFLGSSRAVAGAGSRGPGAARPGLVLVGRGPPWRAEPHTHNNNNSSNSSFNNIREWPDLVSC